ncbi:MAG: hypothetical protein ACJ75B_18170 [Flavisolibacter sp.]
MKWLLSLKHWQLFLLFLIYGFWFFESPLLDASYYLGLIFFVLWSFSIGYYGQEQIVQSGLKRMNVPMLVCSTVFILFTIVAAKFYAVLPAGIYNVMDLTLPVLFFIAIAAGVYILFFAAKTLSKIELQREVKFNDYFTNFLLMCVFIWGIWVLQPKANKLIASPGFVV